MLFPTTNGQLKRQKDFQNFLLSGFIDINHLKDAVYAENPNMDEEERRIVAEDIDRFNRFLKNTESSQSIVSEMAILDRQHLPFRGFDRLRMGSIRSRGSDFFENDESFYEPVILQSSRNLGESRTDINSDFICSVNQ